MDRREMVLYCLSAAALIVLPGCALPKSKPIMEITGRPVSPPLDVDTLKRQVNYGNNHENEMPKCDNI